MSWELSLLTLIVSVFSIWTIRSSNTTSAVLKAIGVVFCALAFYPDPVLLIQHLSSTAFQGWNDIRFDVLLVTHFRMVLTLGAVVWLLHRSWQTLWKPVPELINILGVDVPEAPDVSLAGIRADAATLTWTKPPNNRPVQKYLIQVNGINVGESPHDETAITVTGLKPSHFYNIRVVAIGQNNFQAASDTVRLRTFGSDGRPSLGNARLPANFVDDEDTKPRGIDDGIGSEGRAPSFAAAAVETAPPLDGAVNATRDLPSTAPGQRRNTLNRRHSPSVASSDQASIRQFDTEGPEPSLDELNHRFQEIRKEINDTLSLQVKEEEEFLQAEEELRKEKDVKKMSLKEKEEQTAQLKSLVRTTMEQMRAAEKERAKKDQQLKDRDSKKSKVRDNISKLEKEIERMRKECSSFQDQKASLKEKRDQDICTLNQEITTLQEEHNELEADLSNKGKQLNEMKEARKHLSGADDELMRESDERSRREWEVVRNTLHHRLVEETKASHQLDQHYQALIEQLSIHHHAAFFNQSDAPPLDFDDSAPVQQKRESYHSSEPRLSPPTRFVMSESNTSLPPALGRPSFGPVLFIPNDANDPQTEDELKTTAGPLSPSAHAYLPSGIIDFEGSDSKATQTPLLPESVAAGDEIPQSPVSSNHSLSIFSSPRESSTNLPFPSYQDNSDRGSLNLNSSPAAPPASGLRLASLLSGFRRGEGAKADDEGGPPIGSLKPGQSQSFPRGTDESELFGSRRRMSFSFKGHRNSTGFEGNPTHMSTSSKMFSRRLNPFASSASAIFSDRDPHRSRPPSIASGSDLPRPSTDSGSIWGAPGDVATLAKNRLWSPNEGRWPSRSGSRRPSIHGSPSALTTSLASADDEILYETELLDPQTSPSQVGVIGSRPPGASKSISQRLNPNAPTFKGLFRKDKDKDRAKDKAKDGKGKGKEALSPTVDSPTGPDESPSDSRLSRDTFSVHTQTSVSESHESLPLEGSSSNTNLEMNSSLSKDSDSVNGIRKLLRKGSSSKFSLSSRLGKDSSLFKKGPGSATNSDRNASADHRSSIGDLDELGEEHTPLGRSYDSVTSSPSLAPSKSKDVKESRMSNWRFMKKKGKDASSKEKESVEIDRSLDED
ncbi:unnamed protein product [Clonostachys rhizophaga]|uniref:Fibronectin type-III domain-containing protein n=1 Tax=Clonostachys rhizophaga TaxID=160324 RepID=A0A9N9VVE9_9HYPO|nr:unnamed protein product [Clonostachys rhizophaga]